MVNAGLFVRMEAKAGKEKEAEDFLRSAEPIVQGEPGTVAVRRQLGPSAAASAGPRNTDAFPARPMTGCP